MSAQAIPTRLSNYFKDYASYHKTPGNKVCHYFGIPAITVTLLGLLAQITFGQVPPDGPHMLRLDAGIAFWALAVLWYLRLEWRLAIPFGFLALGGYFIGRALPSPALWTVFILGWVIQFVGHYAYEKKSPAFFKNVEHILIGPLWIFARSVGYLKK